MIKRDRLILLAGGVLAMMTGLFLFSCDKLDPPYATVPGQDIDTTNRPTVLLEDYTGIKCVNCPAASVVAHTLEKLYKEKVIVMAVHSGYYAIPDASGLYTADYRTPEGTYWYSADGFGLSATPMGLINRADFNGVKPQQDGVWSTCVKTEFEKTKEATVSIAASAADGAPMVSATVVTNFLVAKIGTWMLNVCILEDSIISPQKNTNPDINNGKDIENYVHMNMLRKTLTGNLGEMLVRNPGSGTPYSKNYSFQIDPSWKTKHLSVVAFVSDSASRTIIQAGKKSLSGL